MNGFLSDIVFYQILRQSEDLRVASTVIHKTQPTLSPNSNPVPNPNPKPTPNPNFKNRLKSLKNKRSQMIQLYRSPNPENWEWTQMT